MIFFCITDFSSVVKRTRTFELGFELFKKKRVDFLWFEPNWVYKPGSNSGRKIDLGRNNWVRTFSKCSNLVRTFHKKFEPGSNFFKIFSKCSNPGRPFAKFLKVRTRFELN